jgi:hypothetical protein
MPSCSVVREPLLKKIIENYHLTWPPAQKSQFLTEVLELHKPAHANRLFQDLPLCTATLGCHGVLFPLLQTSRAQLGCRLPCM